MKRPLPHSILIPRLAMLLAAVTLTTSVTAATATWKGGAVGVPDVWNISQNWTGSPSPGSDVVFGSSFFVGMIQNSEGTIGSLTITKEGYGFQDSGIAGTSLNVTSGVTVDLPVSGAMAIFNTPVKLDASQTFTVNNRSTIQWNDPVNLNGKTLTLDGLGTHEVNGGITGAGNLLKSGAGRVEINGPVTGGGPVVVSAGLILFNHATMAKTVSFSAPGIVAGTGTAASLVGSSGTVRPGDGGAGILNVTGSIILSGTAVVQMELNGNIPGTGHDQLIAGQNVTLNNATLSLTVNAGYPPQIGFALRLIDYLGANPVTGTFAGLPEGAPLVLGGTTFRISYAGGTGNDVTITPISVAATGQERVWTGAVDQFWATPGNWVGGIAPQPGDSVQFPEVAAAKKNANSNFPWGYPLHLVRITAGGYSLSGFGVHLSDGIVQQATAGAAPNSFTFDLGLPASGTPAETTRIRLQSGGNLTVNPATGFVLPLAQSTLVLQNDVPGAVLKSMVSVVLGAGVIVKDGAGPVVLAEPNSHTGGTRIYAGELRAAVSGSLSSGLIGVDAGAVLELSEAGGGSGSYANALDLSGTLRTAAGSPAQTWSGPVQLPNNGTAHVVTAGGSLIVSGPLGGGGGLTLAGSNAITFSGGAPNTYAGPTSAAAVQLILAKPPGVTAIPGALSITGGGLLSSNSADQISDAGVVTLSDGSVASLTANETIAGLNYALGTVVTTALLTITGNVEVGAASTPSILTGNVRTGGSELSWIIADGPAEPDLQFTGSIGTPLVPAGIIKSGPGTLVVTDVASSTHPQLAFRINDGTLQWDDLPNGPGPFGPAIVLNGGRLTGNGRVRTINVEAPSVLAPGGSPGTLLTDTMELRTSLTVVADVAGALSDSLRVTGGVTISGAALQLHGIPPAYGQTLLLIDNDGADAVNGNFAGLSEAATLPLGNALLKISYTGGDGNDVTLSRTAPPAPEVIRFEIADSIAGGGLPGAPPVFADGIGLPGFSYALEISDDLLFWVPAVTAVTGNDGVLHLQWSPPTSPPRRFFRVRAL